LKGEKRVVEKEKEKNGLNRKLNTPFKAMGNEEQRQKKKKRGKEEASRLKKITRPSTKRTWTERKKKKSHRAIASAEVEKDDRN